MADEIQLGARYTDMVTGFTGVATSKTQYLTGCDRVGLMGRKDDGTPTDLYVTDAPLLEFVSPPMESIEKVIAEQAVPRKLGGDRPIASKPD